MLDRKTERELEYRREIGKGGMRRQHAASWIEAKPASLPKSPAFLLFVLKVRLEQARKQL